MKVPGCHLHFWPAGYKSGFPWSSPEIQSFVRMTHRTQGNSYLLLPVYDIIKDVIKNREEQSGEDMYRAKSGGALSARAPVPLELGYTTLSVCGCVH